MSRCDEAATVIVTVMSGKNPTTDQNLKLLMQNPSEFVFFLRQSTRTRSSYMLLSNSLGYYTVVLKALHNTYIL